MDSFFLLLNAFGDILTFYHMGLLLAAVTLGMIVAVLPGIGPTSALAVLIPATFALEPADALMVFGALYYSAMFGGTISAVLLNVPGESSAALTAIEGYPMARKGRAGVALGLSAICSFIGATVSTTAFTFLGPIIAMWSLRFGPPEYFGIALLGLVLATGLTGQDKAKGYMMMFLGLIVGYVGMDLIDGQRRLTFGVLGLYDGIDWIAVAIGLFGLTEVLVNIEKKGQFEFIKAKITLRNIWPTAQDWADSTFPIIRGTIQGFFVGLLPGAGASVACFISYGTEYRISKKKELFGNGSVEGLSATEAANNSVVGGAFIPSFALGIPGSPFMAVMLGGMLMHGLTPGPNLFQKTDVIWPFIASVYVGAVILLAMNLFMIPFFVWILKVSNRVINPVVLVLCILGAFSVRGQMIDVVIMVFCGVIGYVLRKFNYPVAPLILAMVLSSLAESSLRQSLILGKGSPEIFFSRPLSATLIGLSILLLLWPLIRSGIGRSWPSAGAALPKAPRINENADD